jgi:hypothetical protein
MSGALQFDVIMRLAEIVVWADAAALMGRAGDDTGAARATE